MALKISLKPKEKMIISGAVLTNGNSSNCNLVIENNVPLLREKDILSEKDADSPCRRIYFIIQCMYIDGDNLITYNKKYWDLVGDLIGAAPSLTGLIDKISENIQGNRYYQALKLAKQLIEYEQEVISRVQQPVESI